jgi:hypothetical protein
MFLKRIIFVIISSLALTNLISIEIEKMSVSSFLAEGSIEYDVNYLFDNKSKTSWCTHVNNGIDEQIEISLKKRSLITALSIINGFGKNWKLYFYNNRVKKISIVLDNKIERVFYLSDSYDIEQLFPINEYGSKINITIKDIYSGTKYQDTCLSELKVYGDELTNKMITEKYNSHYIDLLKNTFVADVFNNTEDIFNAFQENNYKSLNDILVKINSEGYADSENCKKYILIKTFLSLLGETPDKNLDDMSDFINKLMDQITNDPDKYIEFWDIYLTCISYFFKSDKSYQYLIDVKNIDNLYYQYLLHGMYQSIPLACNYFNFRKEMMNKIKNNEIGKYDLSDIQIVTAGFHMYFDIIYRGTKNNIEIKNFIYNDLENLFNLAKSVVNMY